MVVRWRKRLERIAEVEILEIGEIEQSLLDADALGLAVSFLGRNFEPRILAVLFLLLFRGGGSGGGVTGLVAALEVPAEEEDQHRLRAVRSL